MTEVDWSHIENILAGLGFFIVIMYYLWILLRTMGE